jgi:hypothetical protein
LIAFDESMVPETFGWTMKMAMVDESLERY